VTIWAADARSHRRLERSSPQGGPATTLPSPTRNDVPGSGQNVTTGALIPAHIEIRNVVDNSVVTEGFTDANGIFAYDRLLADLSYVVSAGADGRVATMVVRTPPRAAVGTWSSVSEPNASRRGLLCTSAVSLALAAALAGGLLQES
jgi:hypothetical protein